MSPYPVEEFAPKNMEISELHFTRSEPDHQEKPDSSNKYSSVDLGQLNGSS